MRSFFTIRLLTVVSGLWIWINEWVMSVLYYHTLWLHLESVESCVQQVDKNTLLCSHLAQKLGTQIYGLHSNCTSDGRLTCLLREDPAVQRTKTRITHIRQIKQVITKYTYKHIMCHPMSFICSVDPQYRTPSTNQVCKSPNGNLLVKELLL